MRPADADSVVRKGQTYPFADRVPGDVMKAIYDKYSGKGPARSSSDWTELRQWCSSYLRAAWTGEKRPPLAGEWFLSGAKVEAYRAANDLTTAYHVARLVIAVPVEGVEITEIELDAPEEPSP